MDKYHSKRVYEDEGDDLNKVVFENLDRTKTVYLFDFPVKYVDTNGKIKDISLEIADSTSGGFKTAANATVTTFSAQASDGISLSGNGTNITLIPIMPTVSAGTQAMTAGSKTGSLGSISADDQVISRAATRIDEKTIQYRYDSKTTIEYGLTYTGFKEDIVVSEYTGQTEYAFTLRTGGYALEEIDGSYFLVDEAGNIKATIGDIIIFTADERNNTMGQLVPKTIVENEEYLLTIVVDPEFLADENTAYPIRIDPTVEINYDNNGAGAIQDATVYTDDTTNGALGSIFVGLKQNGGIARILMKFPGLDLDSLGEDIQIQSATVTLRDLLCESTSLDVYCHVYAGAVWNESNVCWDNTIGLSPNYLSTQLDMKTISYSIGTALPEQHRYSFDITQAVEGWMVGNYDQNKGIVFKANDSVENGSTYNWRTMGSYNRASYKPTLSVTYSPSPDRLVSDGIHYFNNDNSGKYICYTTSGALAFSGLLANLGTSIQWEVIYSNNGNGYVIRAKDDPTKYLAVPESVSSNDVELVSVSNTAIPARCYWSISIANGGGCLVRNNYNSKYLYSSSIILYTSATTGTIGTSDYYSRVWRIANVSHYGNTSSHFLKELSGFGVDSFTLKMGTSKSPEITPLPTDAAWAEPSDFTYSGYDTSKLVYDDVTHMFSPAASLTTAYAATVTATHKVTGYTATFKIVANPRAALIAVNDPSFNAYTDETLVDAQIPLGACGYACDYQFGSYTTAQMDAYLDDDATQVCVIVTHGNSLTNENGEVVGSYIELNKYMDTNIVKYCSNGSIANLDLSNLELLVFLSCKTANRDKTVETLPYIAVQRGATTAVALHADTIDEALGDWIEMFLEKMEDGDTVASAVASVSACLKDKFDQDGKPKNGMDSWVIYGDPNTKLTDSIMGG